SAARRMADEAVAMLGELGDTRQLAVASLTRAIVAQDQGDHTTAQRLLEQALATFEELDDPRAIAPALANLGALDTARADRAGAPDRPGGNLTIQQARAGAAGAASVLDRFAPLAVAQGRHVHGLRQAGAAAALRTAVGTPLPPAGQARLDAGLAP